MERLENEKVEHTDEGVRRTWDAISTHKREMTMTVRIRHGGLYVEIEDGTHAKISIEAADAEHIGNLLIKRGREAVAQNAPLVA